MENVPVAQSSDIVSVQVPPVQEELFVRLKALRNDLAVKERVPLYVVFANASLAAMATYLPQTKEALGQLKGVGQYRLYKYGDQFLSLITEYCKEKNLTPQLSATLASPPEKKSDTSSQSVETSFLYFKQGLSVEDIAALRKLEPRTIVNHLVQAYASGADLPIETFVPAEKQQALVDIFQKLQTTQLTTIMEKLSGYSYDDLRWVRAKMQRKTGSVQAMST